MCCIQYIYMQWLSFLKKISYLNQVHGVKEKKCQSNHNILVQVHSRRTRRRKNVWTEPYPGYATHEEQRQETSTEIWFLSPELWWHTLPPGMHTHTVQEAHPRHEQRKETSTEIWFLFPRTVYGICCYLVCMLILYRRLIRDKNKEKRRHPKYGSFSPELWHILLAMHSRLTLSTLEYTGRRLIREPVLCYYILLYLQPALTKP